MLLCNGIGLFIEKCLAGLELNSEACEAHAAGSLALATIVSETYGYETGLAVARKAAKEGTDIREAAITLGIMDEAEATELLNPLAHTDRRSSMLLIDKYRLK